VRTGWGQSAKPTNHMPIVSEDSWQRESRLGLGAEKYEHPGD